ncbi:MAG TPA: translation elongation factor Ts [Candidatus Cloacimonadota bacterium]|nr:translation elongation factor Ts [Candidatus Cloacimonadota bacterium]HOQ80452.1 translation elongation factor Ts [Candidatus Cloacimonadota bacterium]HPY95926.1 translation elongation factor Ts [Candidatus Cloacimonadota bacterium]HQB40893.1 translation elongation factor Ts [Candidatus Cloacimonadota bacterium]
MEITASLVKELRDKTGAGMMECKKALVETKGNLEDAVKMLRERGIAKAASKSERATKEGMIYSYIHSNNRIGCIVEINCETDFVARTADFENLCKDLCMQIVATNPLAVKSEDLDQKVVEEEKDVYRNKALNDGKDAKFIDRIVEGQIQKFFKENCLLSQEFIKDDSKTVQDIINEAITKTGENIQVARFVRYALGE